VAETPGTAGTNGRNLVWRGFPGFKEAGTVRGQSGNILGTNDDHSILF
jgi:hypothetical protein